MHKKWAKEGLVALTVSLDEDGRNAKVQQDVLKRLTASGATFTNVILDEDFEWAQKQLRFSGLPCVYVFNRQGKWKQFTEFDDEGQTYHEIDKLVVEWLKQK
jgi:hypothetical protein